MARRNKNKQKRRRKKSDRKRTAANSNPAPESGFRTHEASLTSETGDPVATINWAYSSIDQAVVITNGEDPHVVALLADPKYRQAFALDVAMKEDLTHEEALAMVEAEWKLIQSGVPDGRLTWKYDGRKDELILGGANPEKFLAVLKDEEGRQVLIDEIHRTSNDLDLEKIELLVDDWYRRMVYADVMRRSPALAFGLGMMGTGPAVPDPVLKLTPQEVSRRAYIKMMECLYIGSRGRSQTFGETVQSKMGAKHAFPGAENKDTAESRMRDSRLAWALMRTAKLFHISPETFAEFHHAADEATCQASVGLSSDEFWIDKAMTQDNATKHYKFLTNANENGPDWPEHLPFDRMFIGYGAGYWDDPERLRLLWTMRGSPPPDGYLQAGVVGHLVTAAGDVWEFMQVEFEDGGVNWASERIRFAKTGWSPRFHVSAWIIPALLNMINENRTYIEQRAPLPHERRTHKDHRKGMGIKGKDRIGHVPAPFFVIKVKDSTIHERVPALVGAGFKRQLSYKTDVRAHERVFVRRGPLPMGDEEREKYKGLGYRVYEQRQLSDEDRRRLSKRGHAQKRPGEWLAVKHVWIDEHMNSNDPNLEYVPALRVVPGETQAAINVDAKPVNPTGSER